MGGQVDATIDGYTGMAPHHKAGRVRVLAITNPTRASYLPDIPTISEHVPGYVSQGWFGYIAPAGTPKQIVAILNREINRAMSMPDVKEKLNSIGLTVVTESPEYFGKLLKSDHEKYGKLIRDIGFKPQ